MAEIMLQLRTALDEPVYQAVDLTGLCEITEIEPEDFDAIHQDIYGAQLISKRAVRRRLRVTAAYPLTTAQVETLRGFRHNRTRIALNPNWNADTVLYTRFARNSRTNGLASIIGPSPTFLRPIGNSSASATRLREDGRLELLPIGRPRHEQSSIAGGTWKPFTGIRQYGRQANYWGPSHPENGNLLWALTGGGSSSWAWTTALESVIVDRAPGAGLFYGATGDYIQRTISSYGSNPHSASIWVKGEGTMEFFVSTNGGATTYTTGNTVLSGDWQMLRIENMTLTGTTTFRLYSRATLSWCAVSDSMLTDKPRITGHVYNPTVAAVTLQEDDVSINLQMPYFGSTIYCGVEMPNIYASGEQPILGIDQTGGNRFTLLHTAPTNKFYFQRKTAGTNVQWTPEKTAGNPTVIALWHGLTSYIAYENGNFKATAVNGNTHTIASGLHIGWDGVDDRYGWNGLVYFVRVDQGGIDTSEIGYVAALYSTPEQRIWTKLAEGRLFQIEAPEHALRVGINNARFDLVEIDSYPTATSEEP